MHQLRGHGHIQSGETKGGNGSKKNGKEKKANRAAAKKGATAGHRQTSSPSFGHKGGRDLPQPPAPVPEQAGQEDQLMEATEIEPSSGSSFSTAVSSLAVTELDTTSAPADLFSSASVNLQ